MEDPNPAWANSDDCNEWSCTGPNNVVLAFNNTQYEGYHASAHLLKEFSVVGSVSTAVEAYQHCQLVPEWSAGVCTNEAHLGMLLFESLDADSSDRTIQPVNITGDTTSFSNDLNSFMDHSWSNFYAGQKRLSRFPSQIETGQDYTVRFTGTPAKSFRFTLDSVSDEGVKIKIPYNSAGAYTVFADGVEKSYTEWD